MSTVSIRSAAQEQACLPHDLPFRRNPALEVHRIKASFLLVDPATGTTRLLDPLGAGMAQLEHIEAIEKRLWSAADTLRANSNYASNEYFLPVMGLVFLRHAYSRFLGVKDAIEAGLPTRGGKTRPLTKEDFSQKSAIFLQPKAQFDTLVALPDSADRAKAIIDAMESIEADYENLRGVLPKSEYQELDNAVLGQLLRTLNPEELKRVSGDVFGRIYEYFLTQFADQKAHDGGEFFTPVSLVSLIANVIEPGGRHGARPGLRLGRHVRAERPGGRAAAREPHREAHLLRPGKERHHHPPGQDEPGGARPGRRHPEGHHLLRRPARAAAARPTSSWPIRPSTWTRSTPTRSRATRACPSACPASTRRARSATATTSGSATSTAT
jgi:hypothetical protein